MMADKLGVDGELHDLIIGDSFKQNANVAYHSMRYDFKPASVDTSKISTLDVGQNNSVTVTVPHVEGSGTSHTMYQGHKRPSQKECVLVIDPVTGEFRLEKLASTIQLKKTRMEGSSKVGQVGRPVTPVEQTRRGKDSKPSSHSKNPSKSSSSSTKQSSQPSPKEHSSSQPASKKADELSDMELSSDSDSSGSDSDAEKPAPPSPPPPAFQKPVAATPPKQSSHSSSQNRLRQISTLSDDLRLSDSGSDSD